MTHNPPYLRQIPPEGEHPPKPHIFVYNETLAKRPDMVPHWPDGVDPNSKPAGLNVNDGRAKALEGQIDERDKQIDALKAYIVDLEAKNKELTDELTKALGQLNKQNAPPEQVRDETTQPVIADAERDGLVLEAVKAIYADNDPKELTSTNLPRVEAIEARCGLADVTADDRSKAVKALKG